MRSHRIAAGRRGGALILVLAVCLPAQQQRPGAIVESRGVRLQVPAGWSVNQNLIAAAGPIAITNFGGAYIRGGVLPSGGAEIEITSVPAPPDVAAYARNELRGAAVEPVRPFSDSGKTGVQAAYTYEVTPRSFEKNVVIYIPRGPVLYKFYLSYWNGDRNEPAYIGTLGNIVREAQLR